MRHGTPAPGRSPATSADPARPESARDAMADRPRPARTPRARPAPRRTGRRPVPVAGRGRAPVDGPAEADAPPASRPRLTGRAAVLLLLLAVLAVSYASSTRAFLDQRSRIVDLKAEIAERSASIDALERERRRWRDDAFVEQQARERLGFVFPGETSYQVLDEDGEPLDAGGGLPEPAVPAPAPTPWWETAWRSVEIAGRPGSAAAGVR